MGGMRNMFNEMVLSTILKRAEIERSKTIVEKAFGFNCSPSYPSIIGGDVHPPPEI